MVPKLKFPKPPLPSCDGPLPKELMQIPKTRLVLHASNVDLQRMAFHPRPRSWLLTSPMTSVRIRYEMDKLSHGVKC